MTSMNHVFFQKLGLASLLGSGGSDYPSSPLLALRKHGWNVETFCGTTTIIGSAGANVHTSDPGRVVPYSSS